MKAWDDNFVTDTGTAHDGRVTTVALFFSLSPFNSSSLFIRFFLLTGNKNICNLNRSKNHEGKGSSWFFLCNIRQALLFYHFHFQFYFLLKKGDKKIYICARFEKVMNSLESKTEWQWHVTKSEQERQRKMKNGNAFMFDVKDKQKNKNRGKTITWPNNRVHLQNPATTRYMKDIHGDQLGQTSGYNGVVMTHRKLQIFSQINKILAQ